MASQNSNPYIFSLLLITFSTTLILCRLRSDLSLSVYSITSFPFQIQLNCTTTLDCVLIIGDHSTNNESEGKFYENTKENESGEKTSLNSTETGCFASINEAPACKETTESVTQQFDDPNTTISVTEIFDPNYPKLMTEIFNANNTVSVAGEIFDSTNTIWRNAIFLVLKSISDDDYETEKVDEIIEGGELRQGTISKEMEIHIYDDSDANITQIILRNPGSIPDSFEEWNAVAERIFYLWKEKKQREAAAMAFYMTERTDKLGNETKFILHLDVDGKASITINKFGLSLDKLKDWEEFEKQIFQFWRKRTEPKELTNDEIHKLLESIRNSNQREFLPDMEDYLEAFYT